jgi:L-ascorbate metabolism protein UlaG (beta-lactamase superfamily)
LIDPYLMNPASPKGGDLQRVDLVLQRTWPWITWEAGNFSSSTACVWPEVKAFLTQQGADPGLIRTLPWGGQVNPRGIRVRAVECHHTSFRQLPDGQYITGQPLGFILYADPGVRIYHSGDTAILGRKIGGSTT